MQCPKCTKEIANSESKFCPFCGENLKTDPAERRAGIIVFADVSGFTALSEKVDPDQLRKWFDELMKRFVKIVRAHGGWVDKIMGDCIMFVFNAERSFGDNPIRTIEAVDGIRKDLIQFNEEKKLNLNVHVGISYGMVSFGIVGTSKTVMGDFVNLAQRLMSLAEQDQVVVSDSFRGLLSAPYQFEKMAPVELKGKSIPITPFLYLGKGSEVEKVVPFVGRKKELDQVLTIFAQIQNGQNGKNVLILGEAGIGKSRLVSAAMDQIRSQNIPYAGLRFSEVGKGFFSLYQRLLQSLHFENNDPTFWRDLDFDQLRTLLTEKLTEAAAHGPFVFLVEDLHHADESSRLLILDLVVELASHPIYLICTSRTHAEGFSNVLELKPLDSKEADLLLQAHLEAFQLPTENVDALLESCNGNPYFIQEVVRGLHLQIPNDQLFSGNIELVLAATIDTLPKNDQELMKMASILGTHFSIHHLSRLIDLEPGPLLSDLRRLSLFKISKEGKSVALQHDLLRKSVYERINSDQRQEWHGRVGDILVEDKTFPEEIAFHYLLSAQKEKALSFSLQAAKRLSRLPRQLETFGFLNQAEKIAQELKDEKGYATALKIRFEAESRPMSLEEGVARLHEIEKPVGDDIHLLRGKFLSERGQYEEALVEIDKTQRMASENDIEIDLIKCNVLAQLFRHKEMVQLGMKHLRNPSLDSFKKAELLLLLGHVSYIDFEMIQARDFYQKAKDLAQTLGDQPTVQKVMFGLGNIFFTNNEFEKAQDFYFQLAELSHKMGSYMLYGQALHLVGLTQHELLRFRDAFQTYEKSFSIIKKSRNEKVAQRVLLSKGVALRTIGKNAQAKETLEKVIIYFEGNKQMYPLAQSLRALSGVYVVEENFSKALELIEISSFHSKTFPNLHQFDLLCKAEILFRMNQKEESKKLLDYFEKTTRNSKESEEVQSEALRIKSVVSEQGNREVLELMQKFLDETLGRPQPLTRIPLLKEALLYEPNTQLKLELSSWEAKFKMATLNF